VGKHPAGKAWQQVSVLENGYLRMQRNLKGDSNAFGLCGINIEPSYAVKTSPNPPNPGPTPPSPSEDLQRLLQQRLEESEGSISLKNLAGGRCSTN
jgi:hypothetical protein